MPIACHQPLLGTAHEALAGGSPPPSRFHDERRSCQCWPSTEKDVSHSRHDIRLRLNLLTPSLVSGEKSSSVDEHQDWLFGIFAEWKEHVETIPLGRSVLFISDDANVLRRLFVEWLEENPPFLFTRGQLLQ